MLKNLPSDPQTLLNWTWPEIEPYYKDLTARPLTAATVDEWLADWSSLNEHVEEIFERLTVAVVVNTADQEMEERRKQFLETLYYPHFVPAEQKLKERLLASGLEPKDFELPLRNLRAEANLFREANLPLLAEEQKLAVEYDKITAAQSVEWEGREVTLTQLKLTLQQPDRARREQAWRAIAQRQLADRQAINDLWQKFMAVRLKIAATASQPDYRAYVWQQKFRFDYTPADCKAFADAIEAIVVPAATRIYAQRRQQLGVETLRPWDLVDGWYDCPTKPPGRPALKPFQTSTELKAKTSAIFHQVDPQLGEYFDIMLREGRVDLENRKNKAGGAQCFFYKSIRRPFIVCNAVGTHDDVQTTLHETGHAFHIFETAKLPYIQQIASLPMEFGEVASMGMEFLGVPYLTEFYSEAEAARARREHLERSLLFWPFVAIVDAFQHWVYENPEEGVEPAKCNAKWSELWRRFIPGVDWSGLEQTMATGWHRKGHIHQAPFYYVEYGLAQLGAVQIWGNALQDQAKAVARYRQALALGGLAPVPELFRTAGARFAFDAVTLKKAVDLMEKTIAALDE